MAKALLISGLIAVLTAQATLAQNTQQVTLYKELDCQGPEISFLKQDVPDLHKFGWGDVAQSAKVTGAWLFYALPNYNAERNVRMEYMFGVELCGNFSLLGGQLASIRLAGDPNDYRSNALSIYKEVFFQGKEEYTAESIANFNMKEHKSIIGLGPSSWMLYDEPHFKGTSVCVWYPEDFGAFPIFHFPNLEEDMPEMFNSIRSIEKGCSKK